MNVTTIILALAALSNLFFGTFIFLKAPRSLSHILYFAVALFVSIWAGIRIIFELSAPDSFIFYASAHGLYVTASIVLTAFFLFALEFPSTTQSARFRKFIIILAFLNATIASLIIGGFVIREVADSSNGIREFSFFREGYALYSFYIGLLFFASLAILFKKYRSGNETLRQQSLYIIIGAAISGTGAIATNLILPAFGIFNMNWAGPVFPVVLVISMGYAILRHNLLNIRTVSSEVLPALLLFILMVRLLVSRSPFEFFINGITAFIAAAIGILLVRSSIKEAKGKEQIRELAAKIQESNAELMRLDQTKSEFISIASHQLRNPLTVIRGYVSMFAEGSFGAVTAEGRGALAKVAASADQLIELITTLLDLSRIESGKIQYEFAHGDLVRTVAEMASEYRQEAEGMGLHLKFVRPKNAIPALEFDTNKIKEVIGNFIDNAIKYSNSGEITLGIDRMQSNGDDRVRLWVRDIGIGIRPEDMPRLFAKFSRGSDAQKIDTTGMGLGLYFAKRIAEDHGGRVWAESDGLGKGSTFFLELPVKKHNS